MSKKALVRALKQAGYTLFAERVKTFGKGAFSPLEGNPSFILGELSERLDEDFSYIVKHLADKEKQNVIHADRLDRALGMLNTDSEREHEPEEAPKLGYAPLRDDALAWEIYERNTKNPDESLVHALKRIDVQAGENRTTLAVALKEAGMAELADALPARLYTSHTTPSDILFTAFVWSQTKEGHDTWRKAKQTLQNIEQKNATILKDLQKIDPTLKQLNYCTPNTSSKLALYKSKVSIPHVDVLTKLEVAEKLKERAIRDLENLNLCEAADYIAKMEFDLPEHAFTSDVIDNFSWRYHAAGYAFWHEVQEKVLKAEKITEANKENLIKLTKELGHHDKAEALRDIRFTLKDSISRADQTLMAGFGWHSSPQGGAYWNSLPKKLMQAELARQEKEKEMSKNKRTLIDVLKKLGELEAAAHIAKMAGSIFEHDTPEGMLEFGFVWHETPQGYMFWWGVDARVNGLDKSTDWHDTCKVRKTNLIQACFDAGHKDAAKLVKVLPYELFHTGETPVEVSDFILMHGLDMETRVFWEGLRKDLEKISCTAELSAKKRLIDAVYEVTGRKFDTLAELPLSAFLGDFYTAAEMLIRNFDWYESSEGSKFWEGVHDKLEAREGCTITVTVCSGSPTGHMEVGKSNFQQIPLVKFKRAPKEPYKAPKEKLINMHDTYKTRDGRDVRVLCVDALDETYKVIALVKNKAGTDEYVEEYTATGAFYVGEQGDDDLVLHSTKDPRDSLKINDPVYVRDSGEWKLRYYAGKTPDGKHTAWDFGKRSFSAGAMQCRWSRWKVNGVELSA